MGNFHPIGLKEVLRKIQTKMILPPNHYAFLPGKGTGSELIQILNLLEKVVELDLLVDLSTSYVSGAFDSPERTAQYICWRRVGPLATFLVSLAALSTYKISSPYGMRKPDLSEDDVIPELDNPFLPARGLTQGAPESTMGWVVFFDPLLAALNKVQKRYPFYIRQQGSHLAEQDPTCYADDLHLIASCRECTVECNKVILAFAAMFGIKFAPKKLRAITTSKKPGVMILYDWEWKEIRHPFGTVAESIKSLGLTYYLRYCKSHPRQVRSDTRPSSPPSLRNSTSSYQRHWSVLSVSRKRSARVSLRMC
jgi:hypothetical protein